MCDTQIDGNVRGKAMINQWIEWAALFTGKPFGDLDIAQMIDLDLGRRNTRKLDLSVDTQLWSYKACLGIDQMAIKIGVPKNGWFPSGLK